MKCINFDRAFEKYMGAWVKENSENDAGCIYGISAKAG